MRHTLKYYFEKNSSSGYPVIYMAGMGDALISAYNDGTKEIIVTKEDFEAVKRWMTYNGSWNWDMKTFWGMTFIIEN